MTPEEAVANELVEYGIVDESDAPFAVKLAADVIDALRAIGWGDVRQAYTHAADLVHAEARWQTELAMLSQKYAAIRSRYTAERVTVVEETIRHYAKPPTDGDDE